MLGLGAIPVKCDLERVFASDLNDCDVVIHCAAFASDWGSDEEFYKANVTGTENLLNAAREAGVKRFIFIGTEAALFHQIFENQMERRVTFNGFTSHVASIGLLGFALND